MIGNAVPINLGYALAHAIYQDLFLEQQGDRNFAKTQKQLSLQLT